MERPAIAQAPLLSRWIYALKPASWPKLAMPAFLGIALGVAETHQLSGTSALLATLFTVFDLIYVVTLNDWGDQEVDAIKRAMFPAGCSPKTIPDGILPAQHLLVAGSLAGVLMLAVAILGEQLLGREHLLLWAGVAAALFAAYTLPPFALNYRGGGELLEMIGVGVVLPLLTARFMGAEGFGPATRAVIPGLALLAMSSALASGLSDEESDLAGGKRTFTTRLGNPRVRALCLSMLIAGGGAILTATIAGERWMRLLALIPLALYGWRAHQASGAAITNAFAAQGRLKKELHFAIWGSSLALSGALLWEGLLYA
ncbi:MAG: prenyltransferase [Myxococcota bacterium]